LARRDRKGPLNDGRIQNPSNAFGIVPLSNFVRRGFGFVHHSIAILYHEAPKNPNLTIRNFLIAVGHPNLTSLICMTLALSRPPSPAQNAPLATYCKLLEAVCVEAVEAGFMTKVSVSE
jgi:hypothetical protein